MTAYYNDHDPSAAEWLRELIKAGVIPDGYVDERSILDVRADDLGEFTQCHFFAGIGGWPLALRLAGWPDDRPVWTGSPPCQPFSVAGDGKGSADERHLSPKFIGLVRDGRPEVLFGEQVASAAVFGKAAKSSRKRIAEAPEWAWLDDLSDRLEAARYAVGASDIPSAGVGAPHIRQRTFFGAYDLGLAASRLADTTGSRSLPGAQPGIHCGKESLGARNGKPERFCDISGVGNADDTRLEVGRNRSDEQPNPQGREDAKRLARLSGVSVGLADARRGVFQSRFGSGNNSKTKRQIESETWQLERRGTSNCDRSVNGHTGPLNGFWRDADWLFCRDGKWRPVEPGTFPLADGVPGRVGLLRGYGNAINPWAAKEFIEAFEEARTECFRLDRLSALTNDTTGVFG